ncbi:MAG: AzlD domain-containing protein [Treponema sp.]|nr:AzlD domain-containing protein [Treponema sp.]
MKLSISEALVTTFIMGGVIFFCRVFPFLFFRDSGDTQVSPRFAPFLAFVEKVVPPVAMTVLAFNALSAPLKDNPQTGIPALVAAVFTALVHLWKRNSLISIFGGTLVYMILSHILVP